MQAPKQSNAEEVAFLTTELDLSHRLAKNAWALLTTGRLSEAKLLAIAATTAYQTAKKCLPDLSATAEQHAYITRQLKTIAPWIEQLTTIT